jgi:hypothetical protein
MCARSLLAGPVLAGATARLLVEVAANMLNEGLDSVGEHPTTVIAV